MQNPIFPRLGHTFIELVTVILIIGIMAAIAAPLYTDAMADFRVEAASKRIAMDLNATRDRAIAQSSDAKSVVFYASSDCYQMLNCSDLDKPAEEYWVYFDKTEYDVDLVSATFTNVDNVTDNQTVSYDLYGQAWCGSTTAPLANAAIVVQSGGESRTVVIDPVTGRASVQ